MPGVPPTTVVEKKRPFAEAFAEAISDGVPCNKLTRPTEYLVAKAL